MTAEAAKKPSELNLWQVWLSESVDTEKNNGKYSDPCFLRLPIQKERCGPAFQEHPFCHKDVA